MTNIRPLLAAGTIMGIGMGGFVDGILFHQVFQLHNMLSANLPVDNLVNAEINMVWDGLFHVLTWTMTAIGIFLLWRVAKQRAVPLSNKAFGGSLIMGWGLFNLVEGIIDHHIIGIHHVVERLGVSIYDYAFLTSGIGFIMIGVVLIRLAQQELESRIA